MNNEISTTNFYTPKQKFIRDIPSVLLKKQYRQMKLTWSNDAWEDYVYWQKTDKKITKRINELIKNAMRTPFEGIGKPESLKGDLQSYWSRRITQEHRLVYKYKNDALFIAACRYHYAK